ncbi:retrotransposon protein, putative, ty1-copia subclass [Tanacetum coccineum]
MPYELIKGRKPNVQYFHVFSSLCYLTNDRDGLRKMRPQADIEYYATRTPEVLDNSATNTLDNEDTPLSSSIVIEGHDAPQIVSSSEEPIANKPTTLVFDNNSDEQVQDDVAKLDGNNFMNPFATPEFKEAESSSNYQDLLNMHEFYQQHRFTDRWTKNRPIEQVISMVVAAQNTNNTTIKSILLAEKLTSLNFTNWYCNLRIVLKYEKKIKFVEQPIGPAPDPETVDPDTIDKYYENVNLDMGKMLDELHAMLKLHEKGIPKKAETPAVLAIQEGKIQKDKKRPQGAKGKDKGKNKLAYALKAKIPRSLEEEFNKRAKHALDSYYLWHYHLGHINKKRMDMFQRDGVLQTIHDESHEKCKSCISRKIARKPFLHQVERAKDLLGLIHTDGYALESASRILNMVPTKKVERMPYEIWHMKAPKLSYLRVWGYLKETMSYYFCYPLENKIFVAQNAKFFENSLMVQEASGNHGLHESIHNKVAPIEVEPRNVEIPIRRSARIPLAPDRYGFYVDVEEYELGDLNEPPNYKDVLSDPKFDKWLEAINTKMQSIKDNQIWVLVDLPPNGRTVGSKWLFKKRLTWMAM